MGTAHLSRVIVAAALATLVGSGCGPSQEEFDERGRVIDELRGQLDEAGRRQSQTQAEVDRLTGENGQLNERLGAMGQLANDLEEARRAAAEYQRRAQQQQERLSAFRNMLSQFQAMIDSGRLRVRVVRGRMVIELPSNILFPSGRANLSDQGEETLTEVATVLRTIENRHFQIAGHTDNIPVRRSRFDSNWDLSTARAVTVVQYLQEQGVPPNFLSAAGHAEFAPSGSNDTDDGRAENRRIEIVLLPNLDELPDLSSLEREISQPASASE
jgi:chemotaxis protein MotB